MTYRPGDPIKVTFAPSDPKRSIITSVAEAKARHEGMGIKSVIFCAVFWLAAACTIVSKLKQ
jgi:hypothetical protein